MTSSASAPVVLVARRAVKRSAATAVAGSVVLLAAACGGGRPAATPQHGGGPVAFSACMRSNGVAAFPDPDSSGVIPKESLSQLRVSSVRFHAATSACAHLLPNGGRPPDASALERVKAQGLRFAQCVRRHGIPAFPDPDGSGRIPDPARFGIDQGSPVFRAANDACAKDRPPYIPSNAAYEAWAATHTGG
ncbi:MAG: hypothetical protein ABUS54_11950 [Actinomycetota bacterium]